MCEFVLFYKRRIVLKYSKRYLVLFVVSVVLFTLFSCKNNFLDVDVRDIGTSNITKINKIRQTTKLVNYDVDKIHSSLDIIAQIIAKSLTNLKIRNIIFSEVGKRFDGDFDVLFSELRKNDYFISILISNFQTFYKINRNDATIKLNELSSNIPKFNISIPVNYSQWNTKKYIPVVAYRRYDIDDRKLETLKSYDSNGNVFWLDAKVEPKNPVVVVGINERTDFDGNLIYGRSYSSLQSQLAHSLSSESSSSVRYEKLYITDFRLMDDDDGWFDSTPEIYVKVKRSNYNDSDYQRTNFTEVNDVKWYLEQNYSWLPKCVFSTTDDLSDYMKIQVWEEDPIWDDHLEDKWVEVLDGSYTNVNYINTTHVWQNKVEYQGQWGNSDIKVLGKVVWE